MATKGNKVFKTVLFDLMDEYTGLLIDQLVAHRYSQVVICGRRTVDDVVFDAVVAACASPGAPQTTELINEAAAAWVSRITLPRDLHHLRPDYEVHLAGLIRARKIVFYEPFSQQGTFFEFDVTSDLEVGARAFADDGSALQELRNAVTPVIKRAGTSEGDDRDTAIQEAVGVLDDYRQRASTNTGRNVLQKAIEKLRRQRGSRGEIPRDAATWPKKLASLLNYQPSGGRGQYLPSLTIVIGENENTIAGFAQPLIQTVFDHRRQNSIVDPVISFIFDEADVFISSQSQQRRGQGDEGGSADVTDGATLLARRGRKFGLGLGIATQRIRYLNTSIMAQPHTYLISKLPRKSDRQGVAEAFAISDESLEQSFAFTPGQWLLASHDATGLKGRPFPVQLPNAEDAIRGWLAGGEGR